MARKTVNLLPDEQAICRVRYRQVATHMDPGPQPMSYTDRICKAIAWHLRNGEELEHGAEYLDLLFLFGNYRAVSRHMKNGTKTTVDEDRDIALAWVDTQPESLKDEILALLGLGDEGGEYSDDEVKVKDKEVKVKDEGDDVKREVDAESASVGVKRKLEEVDDAEEDSKADVLSKRPKGRNVKSFDVKAEEDADEDSKADVLSKRPKGRNAKSIDVKVEPQEEGRIKTEV
ncbi:hypothetical protein B0H19DRAFT_1196997 [Mycena capillaripes]|nr:hypothetical protein B0H19DRAFT_1196997 [Mycena capillaripes]